MGIGGAERLLVELIARLDRSRFEPVLVCLKEPGELAEMLAARGVSVYGHVARHRLDVTLPRRLGAIMRRHRACIVCTVGTGGDRSFWGRLAARWAGVPVVVSCPHCMGQPDHYEPHNRLLSALTDAFVAVATRQKRYLASHEGLPAGKIHVIYNGVDLARFHPRQDGAGPRRGLAIPSDAPVAGVVAKLRPEKNLPLLLRAATQVRRQLPETRFLVVGDGPERPALEQLAAAGGLAGAVRFVGLQDDIPPWLAAMNVCALSSTTEAFPLSLLEAMACAKPVVATDVGAVGEMVLPGVTGLLVAPGDADGLAAALVRLLREPARAALMGARARQHVEQHFDLTAMVRAYEDLFESLLAKKERGRIGLGRATVAAHRTAKHSPVAGAGQGPATGWSSAADQPSSTRLHSPIACAAQALAGDGHIVSPREGGSGL
jgi:glycosyltransferase involved in cell wall biosynthesis